MPRSFHLVETLGQGAFGAVYLAEVTDDEGFVQRLAVKMLHPHWSRDDELAQRLRDEARLLALLEHDHVVRVHGLTRIDGRLAILMEPIQGVDLSVADGEALPPRAAVEVVEAVADALAAAWETTPPGQTEPLRVVHRDIKPSNIMVTARGGVKVMDFGVARATFDAREATTKSQQFGTARYMAPERWLDGVADAPSDVFSLGITLLELLRGDPFPRPRLARAAFEEDLAQGLAEVGPSDLADLIQQMCAFDPANRPTAREVAARCRALLGHLDGPDLRTWASAWVPAHRRPTSGDPADAPLAEEGSGETFTLLATASAPAREPRTLAVIEEAEAARPGMRRGFVAGMIVTVLLVALWGNRGWFGWRSAPVADPTDAATEEPADPTVAAPTDDPPPPPPAPPSTEPPSAATPTPTPVATPTKAPPPGPNVAPAPRTAPAPSPEPRPTPTPTPQPLAPDATVTFVLEPPTLAASTELGTLEHRTAVRLARGVHEIRVRGAEGPWRCAVRIDAPISTWRVDDTTQRCSRAQ